MPRRAVVSSKFDLKALREKQGLTQIEFAEVLCTTQGSVARWEGNGELPEIYRRYCKLYFVAKKASKPKRKLVPRVKAAEVIEPLEEIGLND